jgi:hypothetical protein
MSIMPGVTLDLVAPYQAMQRYDIVCVHTIVGYWYNGKAAHFTTDHAGTIRQHRDTKTQSGANLDGNYRIIAIENEDHGVEYYGGWNTADGHAVPRFTSEQCEAIAEILAWAHKEHGIPLVLCPDSKPGSRGIAYHRQGCDGDGNYAGYDFPGRVAGGEVWTKSYGKVCPGDRRIHQLIDVIIPRARVLAGLDQEDIVTPQEIEAVATAAANKVWAQALAKLDDPSIVNPAWVWVVGGNMGAWAAAGKPAPDVDEAALAAALAPALIHAIEQRPTDLTDTDLARIAAAVADEQARRQVA